MIIRKTIRAATLLALAAAAAGPSAAQEGDASKPAPESGSAPQAKSPKKALNAMRLGAGAGAGASRPGRKYSALQRMSLERLKALHEDVERVHAAREEVGLKTGLNDYHCILHSHAEDSAHTGGTRPEMLADAKKVGVHCIMLTDHYRPPHDFIGESWRGMHDGVLFIPGSEGGTAFLLYPEKSVMDVMKKYDEPAGPDGKKPMDEPEFVKAITAGEGLIFLSHVEMRPAFPMDGLTGMEIYNNHADAMDDAAQMLMGLMGRMIDPKQSAEMEEALRLYPAEMYAAIVDYPSIYIRKWDAESQKRRVVGVAANDCHHNQVYLVKVVDDQSVRIGTNVDKDADMRVMDAKAKPAIRELVAGHKPGDILLRLDLDPYSRSFLNCSTHVLAGELAEPAIRAALKAGHDYVAHDWLCKPTGFAYVAQAGGKTCAIMGDETPMREGLKLAAEAPAPCQIRMIKNGEPFGSTDGRKAEFAPDGPGVYRIECWLALDTEERCWIYSNPIYVRQ